MPISGGLFVRKAPFQVGCKTLWQPCTVYEGASPDGKLYAVQVPTPAGAVRMYQGMFSGDRGTSSNNTNLNLGYMEVASKYVQETFGQHPVEEH